jgi:hypothetical protein
MRDRRDGYRKPRAWCASSGQARRTAVQVDTDLRLNKPKIGWTMDRERAANMGGCRWT